MTCVLSIIGLSLVGCSNVEQPVKEEKSEVLNEIENVEESTNSYIPKQDEAQVENNNNQVYEVQQPQKKSLRYLHVMIRFLMVPIYLIMKRTWRLKML